MAFKKREKTVSEAQKQQGSRICSSKEAYESQRTAFCYSSKIN